MSERPDDARHYSLANVDAFWQAGHPIVLPISGLPECTLDLDPGNGKITLTAPFAAPEPDVVQWRHIDFRVRTSEGLDVAELTVSVDDNLHGAYGLLTSVADLLQLESEPLAAAVASAIAQHKGMFAGKTGLSQDKEVGLFGELLVLEYLINAIGAGPAVASWQGPKNEEHDFVLADLHLEVKTTTGERRRHMMHGFTQLVPLRGVPLSLVSIQLTRSNQDGGRTLTQLVSDVRTLSVGYRPHVDDALQASGWDAADAPLYTSYWAKRTEPRAYAVDATFPALTFARLDQVVPGLKDVSELSYRVDVTQFIHHALHGPLTGLVDAPEEKQ